MKIVRDTPGERLTFEGGAPAPAPRGRPRVPGRGSFPSSGPPRAWPSPCSGAKSSTWAAPWPRASWPCSWGLPLQPLRPPPEPGAVPRRLRPHGRRGASRAPAARGRRRARAGVPLDRLRGLTLRTVTAVSRLQALSDADAAKGKGLQLVLRVARSESGDRQETVDLTLGSRSLTRSRRWSTSPIGSAPRAASRSRRWFATTPRPWRSSCRPPERQALPPYPGTSPRPITRATRWPRPLGRPSPTRRSRLSSRRPFPAIIGCASTSPEIAWCLRKPWGFAAVGCLPFTLLVLAGPLIFFTARFTTPVEWPMRLFVSAFMGVFGVILGGMAMVMVHSALPRRVTFDWSVGTGLRSRHREVRSGLLGHRGPRASTGPPRLEHQEQHDPLALLLPPPADPEGRRKAPSPSPWWRRPSSGTTPTRGTGRPCPWPPSWPTPWEWRGASPKAEARIGRPGPSARIPESYLAASPTAERSAFHEPCPFPRGPAPPVDRRPGPDPGVPRCPLRHRAPKGASRCGAPSSGCSSWASTAWTRRSRSKFMDEGKLPNLKTARRGGHLPRRSRSTQPSESPVAWASFATGVNPGKHNIFDFLVRDFDDLHPRPRHGQEGAARVPLGLASRPSAPKITSTRGGTSFWVHAAARRRQERRPHRARDLPARGGRTTARCSAGLPLPDIRGTLGTFYYWATDLSSFEEGNTEFGGYLKRLLFDGGVAETLLRGPENPILKQEEAALKAKKKAGALSETEQARLEELATGKDINVPDERALDRGLGRRPTSRSRAQKLDPQGRRVERLGAAHLQDQRRSSSVHGMTQFYVLEADRELQIYGSPVNMDPRNPPIPISQARRLLGASSPSRSASTARSAGPIGRQAAQRGPARRGRVPLRLATRPWTTARRSSSRASSTDDWDLFVAAIETTDRVSHMMWRLIDPKHPMYDKDAGREVRRRDREGLPARRRPRGPAAARSCPKDAVFMVMSDHGFHSFRREREPQHLAGAERLHGVRGPAGREEEPGRPLRPRPVLGRRRLDARPRPTRWASARSTSTCGPRGAGDRLGGRGVQGAAGRDRGQARWRSRTPTTGEQVLRAVYKRDDIYKGEYLQNAPDLQVGFNDGYRVGWQDTLGGVRRAVVENNNRKWSGDHCATATEISGGVFFSNRKISTDDAAHHGPGAHDPEAARGARCPRTWTASRSDVKAAASSSSRLPARAPAAALAARPGAPRRPRGRRPSRRPRPGAPRPTSACGRSRSAGGPRARARAAARPGEEPARRGRARSSWRCGCAARSSREIQLVPAAHAARSSTRPLKRVQRARGEPRRRRGPLLAARARALYKLGELSYLRMLLSVDQPVGHLPRLPLRDAPWPAATTSAWRASARDLARPRRRAARTLEKRTQEALALRTELERPRRNLDARPPAQDRAADLARGEEGDARRLRPGAGGGRGASCSQLLAGPGRAATWPCPSPPSGARCPGRRAGRVRVALRPPQAPALRHLHHPERHRDRGPRRTRRWPPSTRARWSSPTASRATASWSSSTTAASTTRSTPTSREAAVQVGQKVAAGEVLGTAGPRASTARASTSRCASRAGPRTRWSGSEPSRPDARSRLRDFHELRSPAPLY